MSLVKTRKGVLAGKRHSVVSDKDTSYTKSTTHLRVEAVNTFNRGRNSMEAMRGPSTTKAQRERLLASRSERNLKLIAPKSSESSQEKKAAAQRERLAGESPPSDKQALGLK